MFGIDKVFRAKEGFPLHNSPGLSRIYRQNLPYRVFPEVKNVLSCKGQVIGVFLADQPPLAVLLNAVSSRDKTVPGKTILPVVYAENSLKIGQTDERM
jgi:hypothetical protein